MLINETTTKNTSTFVSGYVIEISKTGDRYTLNISSVSKESYLDKNKVMEIADKIKLLVEVASKGAK